MACHLAPLATKTHAIFGLGSGLYKRCAEHDSFGSVEKMPQQETRKIQERIMLVIRLEQCESMTAQCEDFWNFASLNPQSEGSPRKISIF